MKCEVCKRESKMFWTDKEHLNGHSESFWTNDKGQAVCMKCLGHEPMSLQQLNRERQIKYNKTHKL